MRVQSGASRPDGPLKGAAMDAAIVEQISAHVRQMQSDAVYRSRVRNLACVDAYLSPREFSEFLERESTKMRGLIQGG
jgi:tripartite-type tricarboxylate transporter receptor subunit TctC